MSTPLVSVVMSVYNAAPYLREATDSILNQSFTDFEFIIINDGSTDKSADILASYDDPRICLLNNKENLGLIRSLNRGLDVARGMYIARMDADDISLENRLKMQVDYLQQHTEIDMLGTQMQIISSAGDAVGSYSVPCTHGAIVWALLFGQGFAHPTVIVRKQVIERAGQYNLKYPHAEDLALWIEMSKFANFANLPDELHLYRASPNAISRKYAKEQVQTALECRKELLSRIMGEPISGKSAELLYRSQLKPSEINVFLTEEEVIAAVTLLLNVYDRMCEQQIIQLEEQPVVCEDLVKRLVTASRCTSAYHRRSARRNSSYQQRAIRKVAQLLGHLKQFLKTVARDLLID